MTYAAAFLFQVFVDFLDPIAMAGYVAAGVWTRSYWNALGLGVIWFTGLMVFLAMPVAKAYGSQVSMFSFTASLTSAIISITAAFFIRRHYRRRKETRESLGDKDAVDSRH